MEKKTQNLCYRSRIYRWLAKKFRIAIPETFLQSISVPGETFHNHQSDRFFQDIVPTSEEIENRIVAETARREYNDRFAKTITINLLFCCVLIYLIGFGIQCINSKIAEYKVAQEQQQLVIQKINSFKTARAEYIRKLSERISEINSSAVVKTRIAALKATANKDAKPELKYYFQALCAASSYTVSVPFLEPMHVEENEESLTAAYAEMSAAQRNINFYESKTRLINSYAQKFYSSSTATQERKRLTNKTDKTLDEWIQLEGAIIAIEATEKGAK